MMPRVQQRNGEAKHILVYCAPNSPSAVLKPAYETGANPTAKFPFVCAPQGYVAILYVFFSGA